MPEWCLEQNQVETPVVLTIVLRGKGAGRTSGIISSKNQRMRKSKQCKDERRSIVSRNSTQKCPEAEKGLAEEVKV